MKAVLETTDKSDSRRSETFVMTHVGIQENHKSSLLNKRDENKLMDVYYICHLVSYFPVWQLNK